MLYVPQAQDFQWYYSNTLATRPAAAYGATITPNTTVNTFGAWVQLASAANIPYDVYGVQLCFNNAATSNSNRLILANIGVDNAGGTNYLTIIPNLMASKAYPYTTAPNGIWYYFPLYIPAGSSIAVQATSSVTTTFNCSAYFYGLPRRPEAVRAGSYVDVYGLNTTTRQGTSVTMGTTAEGAWSASLGTTTRSTWWWQMGVSMDTTAINAAIVHCDLAAGASTTAGDYKLLMENQNWISSSTEQVGNLPLTQNCFNNVAAGQNIYGRAQTSGTANVMSMIAYGLGG